jgi:putative acetyltransferase
LEPRDAPGIAAIARIARSESILGLPDLHTPQEDLAYYASQVSSEHGLVALDGVRSPGSVDDSLAVGFVMWRDEFIEHLYVLPGHQSRGVGAALLAGAAERMPTERILLWTFQANVNAVGFYLSQGFRIDRATGGQEDEERLPDFLMTRAQPGSGVIAGAASSSAQASPKS